VWSRDLAAQFPDKLKQLQALWAQEAQRAGALPLVEFRLGGRRPAPAPARP
jgi:hypothetical protein